jgi:hypothetical protein
LSNGASTPSNRASSQQFLPSSISHYDLRPPPPLKGMFYFIEIHNTVLYI